jgi:hypothetical protein
VVRLMRLLGVLAMAEALLASLAGWYESCNSRSDDSRVASPVLRPPYCVPRIASPVFTFLVAFSPLDSSVERRGEEEAQT